MKERPNFGK